MTRKRFLFVNRKAPYGTIHAWESLEAALVAAAFGQDVSLAFLDDGVLQLKKGQQTNGIGMKTIENTWGALADHDIHRLYVDTDSLAERGLTTADLAIPVTALPRAKLGDLMNAQDVILSF